MTAQCTLQVTIITDEMLTNSITLRLENMSQEHFLSPRLALFLEGVATVLSAPRDHVVLFNIQNDTDVQAAQILNVSLSVSLPDGVHGERYIPSEDLQERLYLNRTLLAAISEQRVLPFDDNICLREPCENYMRCVSVLKFDSSAPFIASDTILFRPIHPVNGLRCRCPLGFTGDYCETEIDLCYSNPCGNNGRCQSREGGYTCECQEGYTGKCWSGERGHQRKEPSSGHHFCIHYCFIWLSGLVWTNVDVLHSNIGLGPSVISCLQKSLPRIFLSSSFNYSALRSHKMLILGDRAL